MEADVNSGDDPSRRIWGGVDLCCDPKFNTSGLKPSETDETELSSKSSSSFIRLLLDEDEWDDLQKSLQAGSEFFSKDIVRKKRSNRS